MAKRTQLELTKIVRIPELKKKRIKAIDAPLNGFQVANAEDRDNVQGAIDYYDILTSNDTVPMTWTMADNTEQVVTKAELQAAKDGYIIRKAQLFAEFQQKKAAINAATTVEEIDVILEG